MKNILECQGYNVPEDVVWDEKACKNAVGGCNVSTLPKKSRFRVSGNGLEEALVIWFYEGIKSAEIKDLLRYMSEHEIKVAYAISLCGVPFMVTSGNRKAVTPDVKKTISALVLKGIRIWSWKFEETLFDIAQHIYVPKHEIITGERKKEIYKQYGNRKLFPGIKPKDPMIKYIGALRGDLIKITEDSMILDGERTITYRVVR